jgi:DNA-binding NarL/FixJ family response regulator
LTSKKSNPKEEEEAPHPFAGKVRVLLVDDHPIVRSGLAGLIGAEPDLVVCGEAEDLHEALRLVHSEQPHLAIIDMSLKESSGIDLLERIRAEAPTTRTLALSMYDEGLYAERALRAGAQGFVSKKNALDVLIDAIREILAGGIYLSPAMKNRILGRLSAAPQAGNVDPTQSLSNRELEVFQQIGQGATTREIARRLNLSVKTIETYRESVKRKLNLKNSAELTQHAVRWLLEQT